MKRLRRAATLAASAVLLFPATALAQSAPGPAPAGGVPITNPGANTTGLFGASFLQTTLGWAAGLAFIVCLGVFLTSAGVFRPLGSIFGHEGGARKGTHGMVVSGIGALLTAAGFALITFAWNTGGGLH